MYFNAHTDMELDLDEFFNIGAIKEIKLVQKTNEFLNIAMHTAIKANQAHTKNTYLPLLTKHALEFLGLLVLILVISL